MARIPKRSPSSFSRWLSSTVSSLGPASSSAFFAFFNLVQVSRVRRWLHCPTYLLWLYANFINPASITKTRRPKNTTLCKSVCAKVNFAALLHVLVRQLQVSKPIRYRHLEGCCTSATTAVLDVCIEPVQSDRLGGQGTEFTALARGRRGYCALHNILVPG